MFSLKKIIFCVLVILTVTTVINADTIVKVMVAPTKASGLAWDALKGAPDPYVIVDGKSYRYLRCQDSYSCTIHIDKDVTGIVSVDVWDADMAKDDYIGSTYCTKGKVCSAGLATIVIE